MCSGYLTLQLVYAALQGPAAVNKRLSNRGVLAGKGLTSITHAPVFSNLNGIERSILSIG